MSLDEQPRRRTMDTSNGDARRAVAATQAMFAAWRMDLAKFQGLVERRFTQPQRAAMLARCAEIEDELRAARTELIAGLMDAPQKVAGHSRVVDVERALDNIAAGVDELRRRLSN